MSIRPVAPSHLLTVAEDLEIGEIEPGYAELVEGRLLMSPSPAADHGHATTALIVALHPQLPARGWKCCPTSMSISNSCPPRARERFVART